MGAKSIAKARYIVAKLEELRSENDLVRFEFYTPILCFLAARSLDKNSRDLDYADLYGAYSQVKQFMLRCLARIESVQPGFKISDEIYSPDLDNKQMLMPFKLLRDEMWVDEDLPLAIFVEVIENLRPAYRQLDGVPLTEPLLAHLLAFAVAPDPGGVVWDLAAGLGSTFIRFDDILIKECRERKGELHYRGIECDPRLVLLGNLNMVVRNLSGYIQFGDSFQAAEAHSLDYIVCDPPFQSLLNPSRIDHVTRGKENSSFSWLRLICGALSSTGRGAIVLPLSQCDSIAGREDRAELLQLGILEAVIALPREFHIPSTVPVALWVLNKSKASESDNNVLFVDARQAVQHVRRSNRVPPDVSEIISIIFEYRASGFNSKLNGKTLRGFSSYYVRTMAEILAADWSLNPIKHIPMGSVDNFAPEVDTSSIEAMIYSGESDGCGYIIGDNGAGKSLALAKLARRAAEEKYFDDVFAIACGAVDRFVYAPFGRKNSQGYIYAGSRTVSNGAHINTSTTHLTRLVVELSTNDKKCTLFQDILGSIGFSNAMYLLSGEQRQRQKRLISTLSPGALKGMVYGKANTWVLGLERSGGAVVQFDELSSGEQNVLMLIAKVLHLMRDNAIFFIDEPEISLHVSWQQILPHLLLKVLHGCRSKIVIATHSPVLFNSASNFHSHLFIIKDFVIAPKPRTNSEGIEATAFHVFHTPTNNSHVVHEKCAEVIARFVREPDNVDVLDVLSEMKATIISSRQYPLDNKIFDRDIRLIEKTKLAIADIVSQIEKSEG